MRALAPLACGALALVVATAATARAQEATATPAIDLRWDAPEAGCPTAAELLAEVAAQTDVQAHLIARAEVRREGDRYTLHLETRGASGSAGERALSGDSCADVAHAAALVLSLALQAEAAEPTAPPGAPPAPPHKATPPSDAAPAPRLHGALRASVGGSVGAQPSVTPGLAVTGALLRGPWRGEAQLEAWLPRTTYDGPRDGTGGSVGLVAAGLRACGRPLSSGVAGRWDVALCLGPSLGDAFASSVGVRHPGSGSGLWATLFGGISGGPRITSRLSLRGGVEAGPRLTAPTFVLDDFGTVYHASPWEGRAWLGIELNLE